MRTLECARSDAHALQQAASLTVFTTRVETLGAASALVLSAEHALLAARQNASWSLQRALSTPKCV